MTRPLPASVQRVAAGGADLHMHTTASDGTLAPAEMVALAHARGLEAIAITDHDTVAGLAEAAAAGARLGLTVIPGVELSCEVPKAEVHLLGYLCDFASPAMERLLAELRGGRRRRAAESVERLRQAGYAVALNEVLTLGGESVGRPHIAAVLVAAGHAGSVKEAFDRFLTRGRVGYVPRPRLTPTEAIQAVRQAGGVPVLAHPGLIGNDDWVTAAIEAGVMGLEAYHSDHSPAQSHRYAEWAARAGLLITGGSDSHGDKGARPVPPGYVRVTLSAVDNLRAAAAHVR